MENQKTTPTTAQPNEQVANIKKINKKAVTIAAIVVASIVAIGLIWYFVAASGAKKADEAIALADNEYNDSIALVRYMDAAKLGYKSGNRAKLHAAISLYQKGKYQEAIDYLKDASIDSKVVEAGQYTLMGDCYVNLEKYDDALNCYQKAISASDENPQIVPFVLVKEANIYRAQKKYEKEFDAYQTIFDKYPEYATQLGFDIRKYAERARVAAGKQ